MLIFTFLLCLVFHDEVIHADCGISSFPEVSEWQAVCQHPCWTAAKIKSVFHFTPWDGFFFCCVHKHPQWWLQSLNWQSPLGTIKSGVILFELLPLSFPFHLKRRWEFSCITLIWSGSWVNNQSLLWGRGPVPRNASAGSVIRLDLWGWRADFFWFLNLWHATFPFWLVCIICIFYLFNKVLWIMH